MPGPLPPPPKPVRTPRPPLGCALEYSIALTNKCGRGLLCSFENFDSIQWGRKLDDVSEATVEVAAVGECCACLAEVEPWCHELHIFRNGEYVWGGPVTKITYTRDKVKIYAKDVLAWTDRRYSDLLVDFPSAEITQIAHAILNIAFARDDPCVLEKLNILGPSNVYTGIGVRWTPFQESCLTMLNDLASAGLYYTVLGKSIILGAIDHFPIHPIGTLVDEMIVSDIEVTKDGDLIDNSLIVRYSGDNDPLICAPNLPPCPYVEDAPNFFCYGPLERVVDQSSFADLNTAKAFAKTTLAAVSTVPRSINFPAGSKISPDAPWGINDMVPGQLVAVGLTELCVPVYQRFRLQEVNVTVTPETEEEVGMTLAALNILEAGSHG